jgi:hypothetical protein
MHALTHTPTGLFERYFWPHYPSDVRADPEHFRNLDVNPAKNPALVATLAEAAALLVDQAPTLLGTTLSYDEVGIVALARALDAPRRDAWIAASDPRDAHSVFFNAVVHMAAFVGESIVRAHHGTWELRRPLWESIVRRRTRGAVAPFHWVLKSLGDDEVGRETLAWRWRVHVAMASADPSAWPVIAPVSRLPALKEPTYDLLVKYLHQHLPEVRDVGESFPSPAAFTARRYARLGFESFHGGRVLALHGQCSPSEETPSAVEVMWLTAQGYDHADVVPCDANVPYFARSVGDETLEVSVAWQGRPTTHRLSIRGHG